MFEIRVGTEVNGPGFECPTKMMGSCKILDEKGETDMGMGMEGGCTSPSKAEAGEALVGDLLATPISPAPPEPSTQRDHSAHYSTAVHPESCPGASKPRERARVRAPLLFCCRRVPVALSPSLSLDPIQHSQSFLDLRSQAELDIKRRGLKRTFGTERAA